MASRLTKDRTSPEGCSFRQSAGRARTSAICGSAVDVLIVKPAEVRRESGLERQPLPVFCRYLGAVSNATCHLGSAYHNRSVWSFMMHTINRRFRAGMPSRRPATPAQFLRSRSPVNNPTHPEPAQRHTARHVYFITHGAKFGEPCSIWEKMFNRLATSSERPQSFFSNSGVQADRCF
jgi:hypothetical protein